MRKCKYCKKDISHLHFLKLYCNDKCRRKLNGKREWKLRKKRIHLTESNKEI